MEVESAMLDGKRSDETAIEALLQPRALSVDAAVMEERLDERAKISPNLAGWVGDAKLLLRAAIDAVSRANQLRESARDEMKATATSKEERIKALSEARAAHAAELEKLEGQHEEILQSFGKHAGAAGLDVNEPISASAVRAAANRVHDYDPSRTIAIEEPSWDTIFERCKPKDPDPPNEETPVVDPPAPVQATKKKWTGFGEVTLWDIIGGYVTGLFLGVNIGLSTGLLKVTNLTSVSGGLQFSFGMVLAFLIGPVAVLFTGQGLAYAMHQIRSREVDLETGEKRTVGLLIAAAGVIWIAEIIVGGYGLTQFANEQYAKFMRTAPDGVTMDRPWPGMFYLAAVLASTPYFVYKCWRGMVLGRKARLEHEEEAAAKQETMHAVQARKEEENQRRQAWQQAYARADHLYQQALDRAEQARAAFAVEQAVKRESVQRFFNNSPAAQQALSSAYEVERYRTLLLPPAQARVSELDARIEEIRNEPSLSPATIERILEHDQLADAAWRRFDRHLSQQANHKDLAPVPLEKMKPGDPRLWDPMRDDG